MAFLKERCIGKSRNMTSSRGHIFIGLIILLFAAGCGVYSFTGASIPPGAKTISITYFVNNAQFIEPTLSQSLTDALRDRFQSQTDLDFVNENGDLAIEGTIVDYTTRPIAIQGNETAALNRLTVTVKVKFTNALDPARDFETPFTRYEDYPSDQDLSTVKDDLIATINEYLVDDIFNKAVVNW